MATKLLIPISAGILPSSTIIENFLTDWIGFKVASNGWFFNTIGGLSKDTQIPGTVICGHIESILTKYNKEGWVTEYNTAAELYDYNTIEIYKPEMTPLSE